jgi:polar amino acid transport system substrate-binding protein
MRVAFGLLAAMLAVSAPVVAQEGTPMRVGLVEAPTAGVLFVAPGPDGAPAGVTKDLATDMARALGRVPEFSVFPNTGAATEALRAGSIDVSFMPVDDTRRQLIDFGPGYYALESTYLVSTASGITNVAQVDRAGLRVVAIAGTTTFRASARTLKQTQPTTVPSVAEAVTLMRDGKADAFALSRDSLPAVMAQVPGSRIADGAFQKTLVAVAVPKGRPEELAAFSAWLTSAKASGLVRRVFDAHGLQSEAVAE